VAVAAAEGVGEVPGVALAGGPGVSVAVDEDAALCVSAFARSAPAVISAADGLQAASANHKTIGITNLTNFIRSLP